VSSNEALLFPLDVLSRRIDLEEINANHEKVESCSGSSGEKKYLWSSHPSLVVPKKREIEKLLLSMNEFMSRHCNTNLKLNFTFLSLSLACVCFQLHF
jgi:hypothetical protein